MNLKNLNKKIENAEIEKDINKIKHVSAHKEYIKSRNVLKKLKRQERILNGKDQIEITDHAFVRYFDRILDFDLDLIKKQILTEDLTRLIVDLGGYGKFKFGKNVIVVQDFKIITILSK